MLCRSRQSDPHEAPGSDCPSSSFCSHLESESANIRCVSPSVSLCQNNNKACLMLPSPFTCARHSCFHACLCCFLQSSLVPGDCLHSHAFTMSAILSFSVKRILKTGKLVTCFFKFLFVLEDLRKRFSRWSIQGWHIFLLPLGLLSAFYSISDKKQAVSLMGGPVKVILAFIHLLESFLWFTVGSLAIILMWWKSFLIISISFTFTLLLVFVSISTSCSYM